MRPRPRVVHVGRFALHVLAGYTCSSGQSTAAARPAARRGPWSSFTTRAIPPFGESTNEWGVASALRREDVTPNASFRLKPEATPARPHLLGNNLSGKGLTARILRHLVRIEAYAEPGRVRNRQHAVPIQAPAPDGDCVDERRPSQVFHQVRRVKCRGQPQARGEA